MDLIDIRSDTLSRPSPGMMAAIYNSDVGDDCFGEDKTVCELEERCADAFGKECGIMFPTGTMSNQVALRVLVDPGNEVLCDDSYHINFFEASPTSGLSGISLNSIYSIDGILTPALLDRAITRRARWTSTYAVPKTVWLENTINGRGGRPVQLNQIRSVARWAEQRAIPVYMDGARIMNACVSTKTDPAEYGAEVSALSLCFAKGLGAPMGSVLVGDAGLITEARRFRKWYGGAMHQSGIIAAAGLYALENNVDRLADDHQNALEFFSIMSQVEDIEIDRPETNVVIFDIKKFTITPKEFIARAEDTGVKLLAWRQTEIRAVFCLNNTKKDAIEAGQRLAGLLSQLSVIKADTQSRVNRASVVQ